MSQQIVMRVVVRSLVGVLFALSPLVSHALGLGKLELKSALNQPLDAEIDFTSVSDAELKGLKVSLAPRADFEAAGAERIPLLSQIKFTIAKRPDGRHYVLLKTDQPVVEPFLFVVLQVDWAGGRLVREYTALLDPPSYVVGKPAAVESPQTAPTVVAPSTPPPSTVETVPPPTPAGPEGETRLATPAPPAAEPLAAQPPQQEVSPRPGETQEVQIPTPSEATQPAIAAQESDWSNAVEYTVRPGDTLWAIAERIRADGNLSTEQVILAIFRNNPDAFFRNNVNNVYAGKVLKIPERDAVAATPLNAARREFRAQYSAWKEYKTQLAARGRALKVEPEGAEPAAPTSPDTAQSKPSEEKKAATAAAPTKESEELLKIVRGAGEEKQKAGEKSAETESSKAAESRERTALAERVATLDESLESKRLENRELTEKVGQVRSQIKNEKRLIELENETVARQTAKPAEPTPEAPKPEAKPEPAPTPAPEAKTAAPPPPAKPVEPAPKPRARPPAPPSPPAKSLVDTIIETVTDGSVLPLVGGVLVLLVGGVLMIYMRRRRRSIAEFEESILASDAIATEASPTSAETTGQVTTGDTSFLSDFSKGGMGQVHTDEVDPVAEAEVYLAYGRDETAEEILKEAIVKNPERHELKQKLLEIYAQRNDVGAFETLAEELYAAVAGRGSKVWEKVEEMGRKLNPDNPMFRGGAPEQRGAGSAGNAPPSSKTVPAASAFGAAASTRVADQPASVDFEFETGAGSQSAAADTGSIEFGLDTEDLPGTPASAAKPRARGGATELDEFKLDTPVDDVVEFDAAKGNGSDSVSFGSDAARGGGDDDIKWDLDTQEPAASAAGEEKAASGNGADEQWDETATKLDLAKAYIDMGDAEGARSILDEVLAEGNDAQKKQAAELAAQIA